MRVNPELAEEEENKTDRTYRPTTDQQIDKTVEHSESLNSFQSRLKKNKGLKLNPSNNSLKSEYPDSTPTEERKKLKKSKKPKKHASIEPGPDFTGAQPGAKSPDKGDSYGEQSATSCQDTRPPSASLFNSKAHEQPQNQPPYVSRITEAQF